MTKEERIEHFIDTAVAAWFGANYDDICSMKSGYPTLREALFHIREEMKSVAEMDAENRQKMKDGTIEWDH